MLPGRGCDVIGYHKRWNVIIEHPFWGAAEQVVVLYVPRPFPSPRSGYGW